MGRRREAVLVWSGGMRHLTWSTHLHSYITDVSLPPAGHHYWFHFSSYNQCVSCGWHFVCVTVDHCLLTCVYNYIFGCMHAHVPARHLTRSQLLCLLSVDSSIYTFPPPSCCVKMCVHAHTDKLRRDGYVT